MWADATTVNHKLVSRMQSGTYNTAVAAAIWVDAVTCEKRTAVTADAMKSTWPMSNVWRIMSVVAVTDE